MTMYKGTLIFKRALEKELAHNQQLTGRKAKAIKRIKRAPLDTGYYVNYHSDKDSTVQEYFGPETATRIIDKWSTEIRIWKPQTY